MNKKFVSGLAALAVVFSGAAALPAGTFEGFSLTADAENFEIVAGGACGENVSWVLLSEGTLTISGSGDMANYDSRTIPWYANVQKIRNVVISDGVTSIGKYAFYDCINLESITIPKGVASIGELAFFDCESLESITVPEGAESIGLAAFDLCKSLKSVVLPDSIEYIDKYAFYRCESLTSINIPKSMTSISTGVFDSCTSLTSIIIPETLTSIGEYAFDNCRNLENVTIPESVTYFGSGAFWDTKWLDKKQEEDPLVIVNNILIDGYAASGDVAVPDGVKSIGEMAFDGCESLESIKLPDSVVSIGGGAFGGCTSLSGINIPEGVTSIEGTVFYGCESLESIKLPDSITSIGRSAFEGCSSLKSITIPKSVKSIAVYAFGYYYEDDLQTYEDFTIKGSKGSAAEIYANENGFTFIYEDDNKYPAVTSKVNGRYFRLEWTAVPDAEKYGLAVYQSGSWRVKAQFSGDVTTYTSPKVKKGTYKMVVCAKVNGEWVKSGINKRAFTVTIE